MNDAELKELQRLLLKLKVYKPELDVLVVEYSEEKIANMTYESADFCHNLIHQIDICLDDKRNNNLR